MTAVVVAGVAALGVLAATAAYVWAVGTFAGFVFQVIGGGA